MPTIANPQIVQTPSVPGFLSGGAAGIGQGVSHVGDLLLQAILSGQLQVSRTPTPGSYTAPGGATTPISPAETQLSRPTVNLSQLIQRSGAASRPGVQFQPSGVSWQLQPGLQRQLQLAQLQEAQGKIAQQPYELATKALEGENLQANSSLMRSMIGKQPLPQDGQTAQAVTSPGFDAATPLNEYLTSRQEARRTPIVSYLPQIGLSGKSASVTMRPQGNRPLSDSALSKVQDTFKTTRDLENVMTHAQQFLDQFGPLNPAVQGGTFANLYRQAYGQRGLDAFLREWGNAELNYRKSQEGLRLVMGGQSLAMRNFPNPQQQTGRNFLETAKRYLGEGVVAMDDSLQLAHENGSNVSHISPYLSPLLQDTPASEFIAQAGQRGRTDRGPTSAGAISRPGGVLHIDAKGNRAYVYPDGSYQEIP